MAYRHGTGELRNALGLRAKQALPLLAGRLAGKDSDRVLLGRFGSGDD